MKKYYFTSESVTEGHSDIAVTLNVYTHMGLDDARRELEKMRAVNQ